MDTVSIIVLAVCVPMLAGYFVRFVVAMLLAHKRRVEEADKLYGKGKWEWRI